MSRFQILMVVVLTLLSLGFFFNRGFTYYDEGFILHTGQRIVQGQLPYRDYEFIHTPGSVLILAAVYKIFTESILTGRILMLLVAVVTALIIFRITGGITRNKIYPYFSVLIYLAWGPAHINFPWPTLFALPSGLLAAYFLVKTIKTSFNNRNAIMVGIMMFITFFFKQNFGLAVLLNTLTAYLFVRKIRNRKFLLACLAGSGIMLGMGMIYFVCTGSFFAFVHQFNQYTIGKIVLGGAFMTAFPNGVNGLFYLFPGIIAFAAWLITFNKPEAWIYSTFVFFFYLFGIRPTTDYVHLVPLIAITGIPIACILERIVRYRIFRHSKIIVICGVYIITGILIILGFYTAIRTNYYRWTSPLIEQHYFLNDPRAQIFSDQKFSILVPEILSLMDKYTKRDDNIFIFYNAPMFYFLSGRKNPTRYLNLTSGFLSTNEERQVIKSLESGNVRLILTHESPLGWHYPIIKNYILHNYQKIKDLYEFSFWLISPY